MLKRIPLACSRFMNGLMNAAVLLAFFLLTSCSTTIDEAASQSANSKGMYVFTYAKTDTIRIAMEDRLVADLQQQGITAYASHHDLPSFDLIDRQAVLDAASDKNSLAILLVNRVAPGQPSLLQQGNRVSPQHPSVKAFFEYTRDLEEAPAQESTVLVEVSGFLIKGNKAELVWSGTTWSFEGDGKGGAISGISTTIADELGRLKRAFPAY
ncbi:MAG: hypothetical protein AAF749_05360 [Pseudomonadota bacterium]